VFVGEKCISQQALIQKNLLKINKEVNNLKKGKTGKTGKKEEKL
jgi:hypothetical protein